MHRQRGRPRWEDIEHRERMIKRDLAYEYEYRQRMDAYYNNHPCHEEYELAYRRRIHELEHRDRMREWDMAHRERMLMEDCAYPRGRFPMAVGGEDESLPPPSGKPKHLPFPPVEEGDAAEHLYGYGEGGDKGQESWNTGGGWLSTEGKGLHPTGGYDSYPSGRYGSNPSGGCRGHKDQEDDRVDVGMGEGDNEMTSEQKLTFKVKRTSAIPPCYSGPCFDCEYSEFTVQVSPITYADTIKFCFSNITANASSVRINLGMKKDGSGHFVNSCLTLMAKAKNVRDLMKGVIMQDFASETFTVTVEQRRAEAPSDKIELVFYPTLIHKASFTINNKSIRDHMNRITLDDNSSQKQSALNLNTLPKNVDWSFLRILFPLSVNGQVIEGEPRSAFVHLKSAKMALIHLASITSLNIDGQLIDMKTDVLPQEAIQLLREEEEAKSTSSPSAEATPSAPKKKKNLSPSDIRRNMRKKVEFEQQMAKKTVLPAAPPFPGVPNLLTMSFKGPGNTAQAAISAFSGRGTAGKPPLSSTKTGMAATGVKGTSAAESEDACSIQNAPIPQILEGPYPPASEYYAPGTPSTPGTSQKIRTEGYFRRNRARLAIKITHHWGCDIEKAGKALARSSLPEDQRPPIVIPPPDLLCVKRLTEVQIRRLKKKVHGLVSVADLKKAEEHWQRKYKKRQAAGLSMHSQYALEALENAKMEEEVSTTKNVTEIESSSQKPPEYHRKTYTVEESTSQGNRDVGLGNKAFTATSNQKFQHKQGTSGQAGHWSKQQATKTKPAVQPQPFRVPAPKASPQSPQTWNQLSNNQDRSLMPPPPPPPLPPPPTPPPFKPPPSTQNQFSHPSPPLPAQAPMQPQPARPPQGHQHPHQASPRSMPPAQRPYPSSPSPRPTSAPLQYQFSPPASSWNPTSASGLASGPPAQASQNKSDQHRPPSASHQQGSTEWWQTKNQQQQHQQQQQQQHHYQQPWRSDSYEESGGQSYNPYTLQQYKDFWQSGGSVNDQQDTANSSPAPVHNHYHRQQYH